MDFRSTEKYTLSHEGRDSTESKFLTEFIDEYSVPFLARGRDTVVTETEVTELLICPFVVSGTRGLYCPLTIYSP